MTIGSDELESTESSRVLDLSHNLNSQIAPYPSNPAIKLGSGLDPNVLRKLKAYLVKAPYDRKASAIAKLWSAPRQLKSCRQESEGAKITPQTHGALIRDHAARFTTFS
jgi:hypothetical protein